MAKSNPEVDAAKVAAAMSRQLAAAQAVEQALIKTATAQAQLDAATAAGAAKQAAAAQQAAARAQAMANAQVAANQKVAESAARAAQQAAAAEQALTAQRMKVTADLLAAKQRLDNETAAGAAKAAAATAKAAQAEAAAHAKASSAHEAAGTSAKEAAASTQTLGGSLTDAAAGATQLDGVLGKAQSMLANLGPYGQAAAIALGVLTLGITALIGTLTAMTIAAYNVIDQRGDWVTLFDALGKGPAAGEKTLAMIDKLATSLPFATEKIAGWAKGLMAAGIQGKDLEDAVKAVAAATALMGEEGGSAAQTMMERLAEGGEAAKAMMKQIQEGGPKSAKLLAAMGLHTEDLAKAMGMTPEAFGKATISAEEMNKAIQKALQAKGAGALENMLGDFPVMLMKVREGFMSVFEKLGPSMDKMMGAVGKLMKEFNKGSPIIKALQGIVTSVFSVLFGWATKAISAVLAVVKAFQTASKAGGVLSGAIAVAKTVFSAIAGIFGVVVGLLKPLASFLLMVFTNAMFLKALKFVFTGLAVWVGVVVVAIAAFVGFLVLVAAVVGTVFATIAGVVGSVVGIIVGVVGELASALAELVGIGGEGGTNFVQSFIDSISGGVGAALAAAAGIGSAVKAGLFGALGIASPSRLAEDAATNVTETFADTTDEGAGDAQSSMNKLVAPPPKASAGGKAKSGGNTYILNYFGAVEEYEKFKANMSRWLEETTGEQPVFETGGQT